MSDKMTAFENVDRRTVLQIAGSGLFAGTFGTGVTSAISEGESVEGFLKKFDGAAV